MARTVALLVFPLLLAATAPVPPDRPKVPGVKSVVIEPTRGVSLGPGPDLTVADFNKKEPEFPKLKVYTSVELMKQFDNPDTVKELLKDKFDPERHILLFARWYAWSPRETLAPSLDKENTVVFLHFIQHPPKGVDHPIKFEHNVIFVMDKGTKWSQATRFPEDLRDK